MHGAVHKCLSLRIIRCTFHIDNRTVANCGFWLEYASKTPLEVVADLPRRMRLFWLRSQIMRLLSVHIKPHYFQNAFDSALLAWYERGISETFSHWFETKGCWWRGPVWMSVVSARTLLLIDGNNLCEHNCWLINMHVMCTMCLFGLHVHSVYIVHLPGRNFALLFQFRDIILGEVWSINLQHMYDTVYNTCA